VRLVGWEGKEIPQVEVEEAEGSAGWK
jgi:hypothetical protein